MRERKVLWRRYRVETCFSANEREMPLVYFIIALLALALTGTLAAFLGFGATIAGLAQFGLFLFLAFLVISLIIGMNRRI